MTGDHDQHHPWRCWLGGHHAGRASTRQAAMNLVDRPWRRGRAVVRNERTGEEWERRRHWFKTQDAKAKSDAPVSVTTGMLDGGAVAGSSPDARAAVSAPTQEKLL